MWAYENPEDDDDITPPIKKFKRVINDWENDVHLMQFEPNDNVNINQ